MPLMARQRRQLLAAEVIYKGQYFPNVNLKTYNNGTKNLLASFWNF